MTSSKRRDFDSGAWRLWTALTLPPLLWGARLLAGWTIGEVACDRGWQTTSGYVIVQTLVTAVAFASIVVSAISSYRALRADRADSTFDPEGSVSFLAVSGLLSCVVFGLLVLVEGSAVYLVSC